MRRTIRTGFLPGQQLRLPVYLAAACLASSCGAEQTCGDDGSCIAVDVDPATLTPVLAPGAELPDDAATDDAGSRGDATDVSLDAASDALRPDAPPALGIVPAPSSVTDVVTMRSVLASSVDPSTGALVLLSTSGPTTTTLSVREAGVTRELITWTSRFGSIGAFQSLGTLVRAEGGVAFVCAALTGTLVTPEAVDVPTGAQPLLIASVDVPTGAVLWSSVLAQGVDEFRCDDLALLGDGSVVVAASKTGAGFGEADVIELDGVGLDPVHVGGRGLLPSAAGAGGHCITLRLRGAGARATLLHARHYAFSASSLRVEPIGGGYAVSGLGGGASAWGTDDDTTGSGSFDVSSLATYVLDGAAADGERRIAGGSILPSGATSAGVALEGTPTRLFVSGRVRGSGIERCAPGVTDTSLPTTFVAEVDIATARCSANARWAQMNGGLGLQHWGEDNLFVLGSVSMLDTAQPVDFFGPPGLTFSQSQLPVLGAYSTSLEPRWSLALPTTPGTGSIGFAGLHVLPSGRELWLHADLRSEAGELLGTPVTGEFWMRVAAR